MGVMDKARAMTELILISKGESTKVVNIPEIPKVWSKFENTDNEWVNVDLPKEERSTSCLFLGRKGYHFKRHVHKFSDEMMTVLNKEGKIRVLTEEGVHQTLTYGQSIVIPYGIRHGVVFLEETKLFINWHPHFENGWEAEFYE